MPRQPGLLILLAVSCCAGCSKPTPTVNVQPSAAEINAAVSRMQVIKASYQRAPGTRRPHSLELLDKMKEVKAIAASPTASAAERQAAAILTERTTRQLETEASLPRTQVKLLNGSPAPDDLYRSMFTHQVAVIYSGYDNPRYGLVCGGTLVGQQWVLTAAHCFTDDNKPGDFQVYLGSATLSAGGRLVSLEDAPPGIIRHPRYDPPTFRNDIALLKLATPVTELKPVTLPDSVTEAALLAVTTSSTISGWGETAAGAGATDRLQYANLSIVSRRDCQARYQKAPPDQVHDIADTMVCAGGGKKDACYGDSGGPLIMRGRDRLLYLEGITSWGTECTPSAQGGGFPGVYTRVPQFAPWVTCSRAKGSACP